jgi:hypothetical protein
MRAMAPADKAGQTGFSQTCVWSAIGEVVGGHHEDDAARAGRCDDVGRRLQRTRQPQPAPCHADRKHKRTCWPPVSLAFPPDATVICTPGGARAHLERALRAIGAQRVHQRHLARHLTGSRQRRAAVRASRNDDGQLFLRWERRGREGTCSGSSSLVSSSSSTFVLQRQSLQGTEREHAGSSRTPHQVIAAVALHQPSLRQCKS